MNRSTMLALVAVGLTLGSRSAAQSSFEGMVTGTISGMDNKTVNFRSYQLGKRSRQEYDVNGQSAVMISDGATGDMITLIPQQKKYLVMNMRQMGEQARQMAATLPGNRHKGPGDLSKMKVSATGRRETIAGISCEHFTFENTDKPGHLVDICNASGIGYMGLFGMGGGAGLGSAAATPSTGNAAFDRLMREGFFPLKMTFTDEHNKTMTWLVTQVDRRRPAAALFAPPPGYTKFEMPGMGGGSRP